MKKMMGLLTILALMVLGACAQSPDMVDGGADGTSKGSCFNPGINAFGSHFKAYLNSTGNSDLTGFGGSNSKTGGCAVTKHPVIFIHGNGDNASGSAMPMGGWKDSRNYFLSKGYKPTELYAVNYGLPGALNASKNHHAAANLSKIYRFIKAVKNYTGAAKVDVIAHSLGVTSVRRVAKGGTYKDSANATANLGSTNEINNMIDTFVGIAGGNRGLNTCGVWPLMSAMPTCGATGLSINNPFLKDLQGSSSSPRSMKVGSYTYSIYSYADELACAPMIPTTCYVYYVHTSKLQGQTGEKVYYSYPYGHMGAKNKTAAVQLNMVLNHNTNSY